MHASACAGDQLVQVGSQDQPAPVDDEDVVDRLGYLREDMTRDEDGLALGGEAPEKLAEPVHPFGIQAVRRLVEDQKLWIAEQRRSEPEPLPHPEGITPDPPSRRA